MMYLGIVIVVVILRKQKKVVILSLSYIYNLAFVEVVEKNTSEM